MRKFFSIGFLATLFLGLNACGGGDKPFQDPGDDPNAPVVTTIDVLASSPQLLSTMYSSAGLQATVRTLTVHHAPAAERAGASVSGR